MKNTTILLLLLGLVYALAACQKIDRNKVDPRPQVYFSGKDIAYTIPVGEVVKVPIKLQSKPSSEVQVSYELTGALSKEEYEITPSVLTYSPSKLTDTLFITNNSHQKSNMEMLLSILEVPNGYREGLINFVTVQFGGSPIAKFSARRLAMNRTGIVGIQLRDINSKRFYAPSDMKVRVKIDKERSTAIEGEHFKLREGASIDIKKRHADANLLIDRLKYDPQHNQIFLEIIPAAGVAIDEVDSKVVLTIEKPLDMSGTWLYKSFNLGDFSWAEPDKYAPIVGEEGDVITIKKLDDKTYHLDFKLKGSLRHYFTKDTPAVFRDEFRLDGGYGPKITEFAVEGINESISPNFQTIRDGVISFELGKQKDGKRTLLIYVYDMKPKEYFAKSYSYMDDGTTKYPMLGYAAKYLFVEQ